MYSQSHNMYSQSREQHVLTKSRTTCIRKVTNNMHSQSQSHNMYSQSHEQPVFTKSKSQHVFTKSRTTCIHKVANNMYSQSHEQHEQHAFTKSKSQHVFTKSRTTCIHKHVFTKSKEHMLGLCECENTQGAVTAGWGVEVVKRKS